MKSGTDNGVHQVTLDLFSSEGAPSPQETQPDATPPIACPPQEGAEPRFHMPLWRNFQRLRKA